MHERNNGIIEAYLEMNVYFSLKIIFTTRVIFKLDFFFIVMSMRQTNADTNS